MSKTKIKKVVKKEEEILPGEIDILHDVCKAMISTAFVMDGLIEEIIHKTR